MTAVDEVARQTGIRRRLLANGYTPLANDDKRCMISGWPRLAVDDGTIDDWADKLRYRATGVRLTGPLVALDFDIEDPDMLDAIEDAIDADLWPRYEQAPVRLGKGVKFAVFMRCEDPKRITRFASMAFAPPGSDPEGDVTLQRLEVFGSGAGRQFGVYGAHTIDKGAVTVEYRWQDGRGLAEVPLADLPEVTRDEIDQLCRTVNDVMRQAGWVPHKKSKSGETKALTVYDLTEDMVFDTKDHGTLDFGGLTALAAAEQSVRLSASWLEGPAARNLTRCIAGVDSRGVLTIYETAAGKVHKPASAVPKPPPDMIDRLAEIAERVRSNPNARFGSPDTRAEAPEGGEGADTDGLMPDVYEETVALLLREYAFCAAEALPVIPIRGGAPMTVGNFKLMFAPMVLTVTGPRGGVQTYHPVADWLSSPDRIDVIGRRFLPWTRERMVDLPGEGLAINTYEPPDLPAAAAKAAVAVWRAFLQHLIPDEKERDWFRGWLGAKVTRPAVPNCAVLMATPVQGTGRGTLFDMLAAVFGERHCANVTSALLLGDGGQAQYTDWVANALLVFCDELLSGGDSTGNMGWKRQQAYEKLKVLFDPRPRRVRIVQKSISNFEARVHASFLMATNNMNALPLVEQDRRVAVIRNTSVKLTDAPGLMASLAPYRDPDGQGFTPAFGRAVVEDVSSVAALPSEVMDAPHFEGRQEMITANRSNLDDIIDDVLEDTPGDFILAQHLYQRVQKYLNRTGTHANVDPRMQQIIRDKLSVPNQSGWMLMRQGARQNVQPKDPVARRSAVFYRVDGAGVDQWADTTLEDRPDLWREAADMNARRSSPQRRLSERGLRLIKGAPEARD